MNYQVWSWILGILGLLGFYLAGKKVWWCWYINIFNQILWLAYSLISHQYGFLVATAGYTVVFVKNAISWTREHRATWDLKDGEIIGQAANIRRDEHGLKVDIKIDSEDFLRQVKKMQENSDLVFQPLGVQDAHRTGWSPRCNEIVVHEGQTYGCAQREDHTKVLELIPHWTRVDLSKDYREAPKVFDIFWDDLGVSHVIEVKD